MSITILTDKERTAQRANGLCASLTRVGRTLSPYGMLLVQAYGPHNRSVPSDVPAFTMWRGPNEPLVVLNPNYVKFATSADYVQSVGLFYHELSHVLFTPSSYALPVSSDLASAYNILEDARIERLLIGQYPSTLPYFAAIVARLIIETPGDTRRNSGRTRADEKQAALSVYPLVTGRTYLPEKLRTKARADFVRALPVSTTWVDYRAGGSGRPMTSTPRQFADTMREVVAEYLTLVLPGTLQMQDQHRRLMETFKSMLTSASIRHADGNHNSSCEVGAAGQSDARGSSNQAAKKSQQRQVEAQQAAESREKAEGGKGTGKGAGGKGDDSSTGDADGASGGEGSGKGKSDGSSSGDADGKGDDAADSGGGSGSSSTGAHGPSFGDMSKDDTVRDMAKTINDSINRDFGQQAADMTKQTTNISTLDPRQATTFTPSADTVLGSLSYERQIRRLTDEVEPGWNRRQSAGKLNAQRAMTGETSFDELFDQWDEGRVEDTRVETVLAIDVSGSMREPVQKVTEASWAVKRAADKLRHPATVLAYNHESAVLWPASVRVPMSAVPMMNASGGTQAYRTLIEASSIFEQSQCKHRLLVMLTDGSWDDREKSIPIVHRMTKAGVITILVYYRTSISSYDFSRYGFSAIVTGHQPGVLAEVAKAAVTKSVGTVARRR